MRHKLLLSFWAMCLAWAIFTLAADSNAQETLRPYAPPILHTFLDSTNVYPESVTVDQSSGTFFVGSVKEGTIYKGKIARPRRPPGHMTERLKHEEYITMQRRRVAELARQIVAEEIDVLDGSCKIAELRFQVEVEDCDQDFIPFVVVSSETDHLPIGVEALNWSEEALVRKEPELKHAREWAMETVRAACASLVARFASQPGGVGPKD